MFSLPLLEIARFRRSLITKLALVIVVIIPVFYGAMYIAANWNPTGQLDKLTAAVVNQDQPAKVTTANGGTSTLRAGNELTKKLVDSDDAGFTWKQMDAATAKRQLADGHIAAVLTIPRTLSSSLSSLGEADPERAKLIIQTDDANNYITGNIGKSVLTSVQAGLNSSTIANYLDNVYLGFNTLHTNIGKAADGAAQLADGATQLDSGAASLSSGLGTLDSGAAKLSSGASQLSTGTGTAAAGASKLADGASQVAGGTQQLAGAADNVAAQAGTAQTRIDTFLTNTEQPSAALVSDLTQSRDQLGQTLDQQVAALSARYPDDPDVQALHTQLTQVQNRLSPAAQNAASINANIDSVRTNIRSAVANVAATISTVDTQIDTLNAGAQQVSDGANSLSSGLQQLRTGAGSLATGAASLASGASDADTGGKQLADGTSKLSDGAGTLASGLADGVKQIPTYNAADRKIRTNVVSTPVTADAERNNAVAAYGDGLAPYFIPVALWVGGMITYQILRAAPCRAYASRASALRIAIAGYWPGIIFGALQGVALTAALVLLVGVRPPNVLAFTGFVVLIALAFTAIHQAVVAYLGGVGRLVALILLVLQLTAAGGTYPIQTSPPFFQAISPYLPLTYATRGLRTLIAGGNPAAAWTGVAVLLVTIAAALAVTVLAAHKKRLWSITRLHPSLSV